MTYNDWLEFIKKIESGKLTDEFVDFLKNNQLNDSFKDQVLPKMDDAITKRLSTDLDNIATKINYLFDDEYLMDMQLVIFRKDINILYRMVYSGFFSEDYVFTKSNMIKNSVNKIFDILYDKANEVDLTGALGMSIKNNRIRWEKYEL